MPHNGQHNISNMFRRILCSVWKSCSRLPSIRRFLLVSSLCACIHPHWSQEFCLMWEKKNSSLQFPWSEAKWQTWPNSVPSKILVFQNGFCSLQSNNVMFGRCELHFRFGTEKTLKLTFHQQANCELQWSSRPNLIKEMSYICEISVRRHSRLRVLIWSTFA